MRLVVLIVLSFVILTSFLLSVDPFAGHLDINPRLINLQETLNALVHSIEMKDIQQQVSIRTDLDPKLPEFVTVDSQRLQQILFNLLGTLI